MKRNPGRRNKKCEHNRVFFGRKKAKECDVWCHERFQPRSGVRYFNWNIVLRRLRGSWFSSSLFHLGWALGLKKLTTKLLNCHWTQWGRGKKAPKMVAWPLQGVLQRDDSSDGLVWPLWQLDTESLHIVTRLRILRNLGVPPLQSKNVGLKRTEHVSKYSMCDFTTCYCWSVPIVKLSIWYGGKISRL